MELHEVEKLAEMARIELAPGEAEEMRTRVSAVLDYVSQVQEIATEERKEIGVLHNVMRDDVPTREPNEYTERELANAPKTKGRFVEVPKVLAVE